MLGLDLQGGSHILLEVDTNAVRKEKVETLRDDVRRVVRDNRLGSPAAATIRGNTVEFRVREGVDRQARADQAARAVAAARRTAQRDRPAHGRCRRCRRRPDPADAHRAGASIERIRQSVEQSIQIVERRVNELGTVEPSIQRQGVDRILVQVPGLQDPSRLKELLGKTAKLTFRMVDQTMPADQAQQAARCRRNSEVLLKAPRPRTTSPIVIEKRVVVSGEDLTDAQPGFDQRNGEPIVTFRFNNNGARRFAQVTQENVGRPFAIVLDNEVISAPVIREPILGGSGQISGNFTVQGRERPRDPAARRRAAGAADHHRGAHRRPGPRPGFDREGQRAVLGRLGHGRRLHVRDLRPVRLFANIAVAINVAMIFGVLSLLNATLTLPGIAGIVLTVGIAVELQRADL